MSGVVLPQATGLSDGQPAVYTPGPGGLGGTITWTDGVDDVPSSGPDYSGGGGWGTTVTSNPWNKQLPNYQYRSVWITYPGSTMPGADGTGCNFLDNETNTVDASVTYLPDTDGDSASTTKSASTFSSTYPVQCHTAFEQAAFGGGGKDSQTVGQNSKPGGPGSSSGTNGSTDPANGDDLLWAAPAVQNPEPNCPASGRTQYGVNCTPGQPEPAPPGILGTGISSNWYVTVENQSNEPSVAVITDNELYDSAVADPAAGAVPPCVNQILSDNAAALADVAYTLSDGTSGDSSTTNPKVTVTASDGTVTTTGGLCFATATVTSAPIAAAVTGASNPTNINSQFQVDFHYVVEPGTPTETYTNTASAVMQWPGDPTDPNDPAQPDIDLGSATRTISIEPMPTTISIGARQHAAPTPTTGVSPGTPVTFSMNGQALDISNGHRPGQSGDEIFGGLPDGTNITPEYVFIAPVGWTIPHSPTPTFSAVAPDNVLPPAGVTFHYGTVTIAGNLREDVVASWPNTVTFGDTANSNHGWPAMNIIAVPTNAAAGQTSTATYWVSDSRNQFDTSDAVFTDTPASDTAVQNGMDVNGDGATTQWFSQLASSTGIPVGATASLSVTKAICRPDASAPDGCDWVNSPGALVPVTPGDDVKYQVTVTNSGTLPLTNISAYDVLPYVGDTGTSTATDTTPRGSTFAENLLSTSDVSAGLTLSYSDSTNPCRPEVDLNETIPADGCTNDWSGATDAGTQAIRAQASSLAAGASLTFTYDAGQNAALNQQACNSVAAVSTQTIVAAEPRAVCASTSNADLAISAPAHLALQVGRPGIVPFSVVDNGTSQSPANLVASIPAGLTVTDLSPMGYSCVDTTDPTADVPVAGPFTLTCSSDNASDASIRSLAVGAGEELDIPVVPDVSVVGTSVCVPGSVSGPLPDPVSTNNGPVTPCFTVAPAITTGVALTKDDGTTTITPGATDVYTLTVSNQLVGETLSGATLTDTLPADVDFVSASDGGTNVGGTVTWNLADIGPAGVSGDGSQTTGGAGSTGTNVTLTVQVHADASGPIENDASVSVPDPADSSVAPFTATASDIDTISTEAVTAADDADSTQAGVAVTTDVLANDSTSDPTDDLDPASVAVPAEGAAGGPSHGMTSENATTGAVTYTPDAGFSGIDSYTYQVCAIAAPTVCDTATVTITVNNAFVDKNPAITTPHDTAVKTDLSDIVATSGLPLDPTSVTQATAPTHGSISIDPTTGAVTYTPTATYTGPDSYQVQVCDTLTPTPQCHTSTVTVTVGANTVIADDDTDSTMPQVAVTTDVLANDTTGSALTPLDPGSVAVPAEGAAGGPSHGTTSVNTTTGAVTYTPDAGFAGTDSYTYQVCDTSTPTTVCDSATVTITVPNAFTDKNPAITTPHDTAVKTDLSDIVSTSGAPLDPTSVTQATGPAHGSISIDPTTGAVTYTPTATYTGPDSYQVNVCDTSTPTPLCHTSTVTVTVGANSVTAVDDADSTTVGVAVTTDVLANDTTGSALTPLDPGSVTVSSAPSHGSTSVNSTTGKVTYTPAAGFSGTDSYTYRVCDTSTPTPVCDTATVTVTVNNVFTDKTPAVTTPHDTPVTTQLSDIVSTSGAPLDPTSVTQATAPAHGMISINPTTGAVTYTPTPGYAGPDSYQVQVCDTSKPRPQCHTSTVPVTVGANTVTATDDAASTAESTPVTIEVLGNDSTGSTLTPLDPGSVTVVSGPGIGSVVVNADGSITYTPLAYYIGFASFSYQVCDTSFPTPVCDTATVTVTINGTGNGGGGGAGGGTGGSGGGSGGNGGPGAGSGHKPPLPPNFGTVVTSKSVSHRAATLSVTSGGCRATVQVANNTFGSATTVVVTRISNPLSNQFLVKPRTVCAFGIALYRGGHLVTIGKGHPGLRIRITGPIQPRDALRLLLPPFRSTPKPATFGPGQAFTTLRTTRRLAIVHPISGKGTT
ncbi:MAG TPA: Ig-like domain-containing protein [Mycobacteriales bacterium]|nr:Ig-like domain-containing protein [Mycobacteriales bacterium]